jgi:GNAT superfamily N-acetyltransferase
MSADMSAGKNFHIREAEPKDLPTVVELWKEFMAYHEGISLNLSGIAIYRVRKGAERDFADYFTRAAYDPDWLTLVCICDEKVVAYLLAHVASRPPHLAEKSFGFISDLMVSENLRQQGMGRAMLETALDWFREKGIKTVELNVLVGNDLGEKFWTETGFRTVLSRKMIKI